MNWEQIDRLATSFIRNDTHIMSWIIALAVGAVIGIVAAALTKTREGWIANIVVGIIGSLLGRLFFGNVLGIGGAATSGDLSLSGLVWGVIGAVVLLVILKALNLFGYSK